MIIISTARTTDPKRSKSGFRETPGCGFVSDNRKGTNHSIGFKLQSSSLRQHKDKACICTTGTISNHLFLSQRQRDERKRKHTSLIPAHRKESRKGQTRRLLLGTFKLANSSTTHIRSMHFSHYEVNRSPSQYSVVIAQKYPYMANYQ